ncbi:hypothetical protein HMPREF0307_00191 [Corynebacterium sp. DNF00584]|nr:hypothetical protein HMPREF0307_00191 [Corynebacterium sp. DNF00584]
MHQLADAPFSFRSHERSRPRASMSPVREKLPVFRARGHPVSFPFPEAGPRSEHLSSRVLSTRALRRNAQGVAPRVSRFFSQKGVIP